MMQFYMPTKIFDGKEIIQEKGQLLREYGKRALIVTGRHSSKINGSLRDVEEILKQLDIDYRIFDDVEENPSIENVVKGAKTYEAAQFVIGVGGGSPLDAAKAIGVLLKNPNIPVEKVLFETPNAKALPVIAIPTTAGTGSEVTPYSILTVHKEQTKRNFNCKIFPEIAFIDVRYFLTMHIKVRVHTCIDALTHLIESYLNTNATAYSDGIVEAGLRLWAKGYPRINAENIDETHMNYFIEASTFAGIAISQTGTSLPHGMGYYLTYHHGLSHGHANGILTSSYLRLYQNQEKVKQLLTYLNMETIEEFERKIDSLLPGLNLTQEQIQRYAEQMMSNQAKLKNYPFKVTTEELFMMYKQKSSQAESNR